MEREGGIKREREGGREEGEGGEGEEMEREGGLRGRGRDYDTVVL